MDNKTYTLSIEGAGRSYTVSGLTLNGNNYVSEKEVDTSKWPDVFKLTATDGDGNVTETIAHARLLQQVSYEWDGGKFYLAFTPVSDQEIVNEEIRSNIEYLAMMADVNIDN